MEVIWATYWQAGKGLPAGGGVEASEAHVRGRQRQGWYAGGKDERN